jgi:hypothetical protein
MLSLRQGIDTYRHWTRMTETSQAHGVAIDVEAVRGALRAERPDGDRLLAALRRTGVAAVPGYWTASDCAAGRREVDRLLRAYPDCVQKQSAGADQRLFGVEAVSPLLARFHTDPFLRTVGEALGGFALYNFSTLGARIDATPGNNGSGDGWHRDAHGFQFKSILYLSDVGEENGPFEYLPGSHRPWRAALDTALGGLAPPPGSRCDPADIARLVRRSGVSPRRFTAPAGTLLLVNSAGIHRGRPLGAGSRYALTNYFYHPYQIDENRIRQFPPMLPGAADRIRRDLLSCAGESHLG